MPCSESVQFRGRLRSLCDAYAPFCAQLAVNESSVFSAHSFKSVPFHTHCGGARPPDRQKFSLGIHSNAYIQIGI